MSFARYIFAINPRDVTSSLLNQTLVRGSRPQCRSEQVVWTVGGIKRVDECGERSIPFPLVVECGRQFQQVNIRAL